MKILITGANGQLGRTIIETKPCSILDKKINLICTNKNNFDLKNPDSCRSKIIEINPDWVINAGAYTQVDLAEKKKDLAFLINSESPKAIAEGLLKSKGKMIQISTDYVFNGSKDNAYEVNDKRDPIGTYGRSKAIGEEAIESLLFPKNKGNIIRTSWLMSPYGNNFALTMLKLHNKLSEIEVVSDQFGCMTSTRTVALTCWQIILKNALKKNINNTFHCCDKGIVNWFKIAKSIGEIGQEIGIIENPAKVLPISSAKWNSIAQRPTFSVLECNSSFKNLDIIQIDWLDSLRNILEEIKKC